MRTAAVGDVLLPFQCNLWRCMFVCCFVQNIAFMSACTKRSGGRKDEGIFIAWVFLKGVFSVPCNYRAMHVRGQLSVKLANWYVCLLHINFERFFFNVMDVSYFFVALFVTCCFNNFWLHPKSVWWQKCCRDIYCLTEHFLRVYLQDPINDRAMHVKGQLFVKLVILCVWLLYVTSEHLNAIFYRSLVCLQLLYYILLFCLHPKSVWWKKWCKDIYYLTEHFLRVYFQNRINDRTMHWWGQLFRTGSFIYAYLLFINSEHFCAILWSSLICLLFSS